MDRYEGITIYLKYITDYYGLNICINDFAGFLQVDKQLYTLLQPYLIHKNPFCMQIKSNKTLWDRCLRMKRRILVKSEKLKSIYFGMCYCGMEEYIVPIICNNVIIGVLCAGEFNTNEKLSNYRIMKISNEYDIDFEKLKNKFKESVRSEVMQIDLVKILLTIVSDYFSSIYSSLASTHGDLNIKHAKNNSNESYVLSHTIEYIKQHYQDKLTVADISRFCHCSESYINHIFKKNLKINIKAYVNKIRIEQAKVLLLNINANIAEIASQVGFNDSNYFSTVFHEVSGMSPSDFKKRFELDK